MDAKSASDDAPPSYDSIYHIGTTAQDASHSEPVTRHLQNHVTSLPGRIRASQQARTAQQRLDDSLLIDHVAPAVEAFLVDIGDRGGAGAPLATLIIVPDCAIPARAELSGLEDMRKRGELGQVSRIRPDTKAEKGGEVPSSHDASSSSLPTFMFSSSPAPTPNSDLLWWQDEAMARRLASCLQPRQATPPGRRPSPQQSAQPQPRSAVQAAAEAELPLERSRRGWGGWGKRRSVRDAHTGGGEAAGAWHNSASGPRANGANPDSGTQEQAEARVQAQARAQEAEDGAQMAVEAQEVAFRVENDLGILESLRGWAIVVTVQVA